LPAGFPITRGERPGGRAAHKLRASEERYRALADNMPGIIARYSRALRLVYLNPAGHAIAGLAPDADLDRPLGEMVGDTALVSFWEHHIRQVFASGQPHTAEYEFGGRVYEWHLGPEFDASGEVETVVGLSLDVSDRRRATELLAQSEASYRQFFDLNPHPMYVVDPASQVFLLVNDAALAHYGYTRDEFLAMRLADLRPPEHRAAFQAAWEQIWREADPRPGSRTIGLWVHQKKDGTPITVEISYSPILYAGRLAHLGLAHDVTERLAEAAAARERQRQLEVLAASSAALNAVLEAPAILRALAGAALALVQAEGAVAARLEDGRLAFGDYVSAGGAAPLALEAGAGQGAAAGLQAARRVLASGQAYCAAGRLEGEAACPPGQSIHDLMAVPIRGRGGALAGSLEVHNSPGRRGFAAGDARLLEILAGTAATALENASLLAERERTARRLRQLSQAVEQSPAAVVITDLSGAIEYVNPQFEAVTGYTRAEALGQNPRLLKSGETPPEEYRALWATLSAGGIWRGEFHNRRKDGTLFWEAAAISAIVDDAGRITHYLAVKEDITARKQREQELKVLADVPAALRAAKDEADVPAVLLRQTLALLRADGAALALAEPDAADRQPRLRVALGLGRAAPMTGQYLPAESFTAALVEGGAPRLRALVGQHLPGGAPGTLAGAPLAAEASVFGVLWVDRAGATAAPFSPFEVRLLTAIAEIGASTLHRAELNRQTERQLRWLTALHAIDTAIGASLDLHVTLDVILAQVLDELGASAAAVLLYNSALHELAYAAGRGFSGRAVERTRVRLGEGLAGQAALEQRVLELSGALTVAGGLRPELAGEGFQAYLAVPLVAKGEITGLLELFDRTLPRPNPDRLRFVELLAGQAAIAIDNAGLFERVQRTNLELSLAYDATIEGWSRALDLRDRETEGHTQRTTALTLALARELHVPEAAQVHMRRGALLHDIGKMGVPDSVLLKPGALTDEEWRVMRRHPALADELLRPIAFLRLARDIPYSHHEKWDGTGYPQQLKGDAIPLAARIFAVADVWDALRSDRPYRPAWSEAAARDYLRAQAGRHFDPAVVAAFFQLLDRGEA
jgi:PAS domain S-box-containing protein